MSFPRYPEYKPSGVEWLGDVPQHWQVSRLKRFATATPSNVDKKSHDGEQAVRLCNYVDVYYNDEITSSIEFMTATASDDQISKFTLRCGDTIITKDSETAEDIAIAAYVPEDLPGVVCGYHLSVIRPQPGTVGKFVKWLFGSRFAKSCFAVRANGLTRVGLGQHDLENVEFPYPPTAEQRAIAAFLDRETTKIDALIAEQERLIELLREKRQAVISHAVTKGLDPSAPIQPSGVEWLGEVPAHWEIRRIASMFCSVAEPGDDSLPILSVSIHDGVSDKEMSEEELDRKVTRSDDRSKYVRVSPGDLVYNMMRAWQGAFGTVATAGMVSPAYIVARPKADLPTGYVERLLRTPPAIEQMRRLSRGVTDFRLRLYWDEFKNMRVPVPHSSEVELILREIVAMERAFDRLEAVALESIGLLAERRSALISAAVTGQIDVRGAMAVEAA
jgi:type I restriction enzyme S subunit